MSEHEPEPFLSLGLNKPAAPAALPQPDELQFQHAEFVGEKPSLRCAACHAAIQGTYYHVQGAVTCEQCALNRQALQGAPSGRTTFLRAALYGLGAAIAGSVIFALVSLTGFTFGIVAILVGIMVGKAIRHATLGRTTRGYQVLAVVLTYVAITSSYIPTMYSVLAKRHKTVQVSEQGYQAPVASTPRRPPVLARLAVTILVLGGGSLLLPFFAIAASPLSGLINLFIIGIGLRQAWRLTAPDEPLILGPYRVSAASPGEPA